VSDEPTGGVVDWEFDEDEDRTVSEQPKQKVHWIRMLIEDSER
jgi:hypothetical protein